MFTKEEGKMSRSRCVPLAYTLRHQLRVERFDHLLEAYQPGMSVHGGMFGSAAQDPSVRFYLNIYPNGSRPFFRTWLSAFVHMEGDGLGVTRRVCRLSFALMNADGRRVFERSAFHTLVANPDATVSPDSKTNWGFRRFVEQTEAGRLMTADGALLIAVELVVCGSPEDMRVEPSIAVDCHRSLAAAAIGHPVLQLLRERHLSDFTLIAHDPKTGERHYLQTHRAVLAAHSAVFKAMFAHGDEESCLELQVDAKALETLLNALYDQTYFSPQTQGDSSTAANELVQMLLLADKYLMETAKRECERSLTAMLTSGNMLAVVEGLGQITAPTVWRRATELLWLDWEQVTSSADWLQLQSGQPSRALALLSTAVSNRMQYCDGDAFNSTI